MSCPALHHAGHLAYESLAEKALREEAAFNKKTELRRYAIREIILSRLPAHTLLASQGVNKVCRAAVQTFTTLQTNLFLRRPQEPVVWVLVVDDTPNQVVWSERAFNASGQLRHNAFGVRPHRKRFPFELNPLVLIAPMPFRVMRWVRNLTKAHFRTLPMLGPGGIPVRYGDMYLTRPPILSMRVFWQSTGTAFVVWDLDASDEHGVRLRDVAASYERFRDLALVLDLERSFIEVLGGARVTENDVQEVLSRGIWRV
ncbi:hypothetical protein LTR53_000644 [Teratosphaeriaceae sp. CCFEE 6253]|nr:hypothetical protein LTR53_000644 [Teratosphaeriaceae sp. CCFEE 6253]